MSQIWVGRYKKIPKKVAKRRINPLGKRETTHDSFRNEQSDEADPCMSRQTSVSRGMFRRRVSDGPSVIVHRRFQADCHRERSA